MGFEDKVKNAAQEAAGHVKEGVGKLIGDEDLEARGRADQSGADLKQAGEKVKDGDLGGAAGDVGDAAKHAAD